MRTASDCGVHVISPSLLPYGESFINSIILPGKLATFTRVVVFSGCLQTVVPAPVSVSPE